jgi:hypothetical protein
MPPKGYKKDKVQEEVSDEQKLAATGVKTVAGEAVDGEQSSEETVSAPTLFIEANRLIRVTLEILFDPNDGKPLMIASIPHGKSESKLTFLKRSIEWMEFSHPSYDDMTNYRRVCASYDKQLGQHIVDQMRLRLCFVRYHLVDWSLRGADGKKIEIVRNEEGLTNESMIDVGKTTPALMDVALTEFEKETLLGA